MRPTTIARHTAGVALEGVLVLATIAALVLGGMLLARGEPGADSAFAAKGGNGKGRAAVTASAAWVSASPTDAAAWGARVDVTGCGFELAPVELRIVHPSGVVEAYGVGVWNTGCMAGTYFLTEEPGSYAIEVHQAGAVRASASVSAH